jgi:predicted DNA-binding protein with PD1-like motif
MKGRTLTPDREFLCRLDHGADWRQEIEQFCEREDVTSAWFNAMGAVEDAEVWFYDTEAYEYRSVTFDEPLEMAACIGNVATLDGEKFAHTHAVLSRPSGQALAGHLNAATVFAGEVYLRAFEEEFVREHDEDTKLDLWM